MKVPYQIFFSPSCQSLSGGGFGFSVDLREDFVECAKKTELDREQYEADARKILLGAGYRQDMINHPMFKEIGFYGWHQEYRGLMVRVSVPQFQENQIDLVVRAGDYRLVPHNIDDSQQFAASFALVSKWLNDITFRM